MDYSFIREKINSENSRNYILSILLSRDGFYFYISGKGPEQIPVSYISKEPDKPGMENLINELEGFTEFDQLIFHKSVIIIHSEFFSLIPEIFYSSQNQDSLINFSGSRHDHVFTYVSEIPEMNIKVVFSVPEKLNELIKLKFPEATILHSACPPVHFGYNKPDKSCIVYHFGTSISVTVFDDRKLKLFNIYPVSNENDLVYFINLALHSCNFKGQHLPIYFMGVKDNESDEYKAISRYFSRPLNYIPDQKVMEDINFPVRILFNQLEGLSCVS